MRMCIKRNAVRTKNRKFRYIPNYIFHQGFSGLPEKPGLFSRFEVQSSTRIFVVRPPPPFFFDTLLIEKFGS